MPFVKEHIPWNKDKKGVQPSTRKGLKIPHKENCKCPFCNITTGEKHHNYKLGLYSEHQIPKDRLKILNLRQKERRHKNGMSKRYNSELGTSKTYSSTKEYKRLQRQKRRSLKKGGGKLTIKTIQLIYEDNIKRYGTLTCYLCLKPIEFGKDTLEHKIPLCRGGTNEYNNLAIACRKCNSSKGKKTEEEYRRRLRKL